MEPDNCHGLPLGLIGVCACCVVQVRAICFWLHLNMMYDVGSYRSGNIPSLSVDQVLQRRWVCLAA